MELLKTLTQTPSVPGREDRIRTVIEDYLTSNDLLDSVSTDAMGSLIGVRQARPAGGDATKPPVRVMMAAHMDQIGFLVRHIDDKGFLRVNPVGGFDTRNLFARTVRVCTESGDIPGVMNPSGRPIHIATDDEKKKIPTISEFCIDLGLPGESVKDRVQLGDCLLYTSDAADE